MLTPKRQYPACATVLRPGIGPLRRRGRGQSATRLDIPKTVTVLLYLDSRTGIFKLLFDFCRLLLVDTLLHRLGCRLD